MVTDHDPHERLYDAFIEALGALRDPPRIDAALLFFQWRLLEEAGYEPVLDRDAQTGRPLPEGEHATLAFSPASGGVVIDSGAGDRWRVRAETIRLLRAVAADGELESGGPADSESIERANRLLASYLRELIGDEPATFRWRFDDLANTKKGVGSRFS
jgi:recombinational DNA repair protein (RecF pathway)